MGALARSRVDVSPSSRARWFLALLLLLAVLGPVLPQADAGTVGRVAPRVTAGAPGTDGALVAALVRPTGVAVARGDERTPPAVVAALPVGGLPLPGLAPVGTSAQPSYDVLAGVPVEPTSRGPPVEA